MYVDQDDQVTTFENFTALLPVNNLLIVAHTCCFFLALQLTTGEPWYVKSLWQVEANAIKNKFMIIVNIEHVTCDMYSGIMADEDLLWRVNISNLSLWRVTYDIWRLNIRIWVQNFNGGKLWWIWQMTIIILIHQSFPTNFFLMFLMKPTINSSKFCLSKFCACFIHQSFSPL